MSPLAQPLRRANALGFFGFVALVERLVPGAAPLGGDGPIADEPIRFRHDPSLGFSSADVSTVSWGTPVELTTTFLGLTGSATPLPVYLAEELADEDATVKRDFLDLFHHRLLSLLYRGVQKYRLTAETRSDASDPWVQRLLALAGIDLTTQDVGLPAGLLLQLLPALVFNRRSAELLERALGVVLAEPLPGATVRVEPMTGRWEQLDSCDRCRLGRSGTTLGRDVVLGNRVFDRASAFRVVVGPVDDAAFQRLEPGGALRATVDAVVRLFAEPGLQHELTVEVDATRSPFRLVRKGGVRLGIDAWLGRFEPGHASVRLRSTRASRSKGAVP